MKQIKEIYNLLLDYNTHCKNEMYYQDHGDYMKAVVEDDFRYDAFHKLVGLEIKHPIKFKIAMVFAGMRVNKKLDKTK